MDNFDSKELIRKYEEAYVLSNYETVNVEYRNGFFVVNQYSGHKVEFTPSEFKTATNYLQGLADFRENFKKTQKIIIPALPEKPKILSKNMRMVKYEKP
jgi:hypothetical protein